MLGSKEDPRFFSSQTEFKKWIHANHKSKNEIWVKFEKKSTGAVSLTSAEASDLAICYGWTYSIMKGIDHLTYKIRFVPRKKKSVWSPGMIQRFKKLVKEKKVHASGLAAFEERDKKRSTDKPSEFSKEILQQFKAHKKAWSFFESQTPSYQKYMKAWVMSAQRDETRQKRISDLIHDSANGSKLARVLEAQEKFKKNRFPEGQTPIEEGKNLGLVTGGELRSIGITTVEQLKSMGWEKVYDKWIASYPNRINLNALTALMGAVEEESIRKLPSHLKAEARAHLRDIMGGFER